MKRIIQAVVIAVIFSVSFVAASPQIQDLDMQFYKVINLGAGTASSDAVRLDQVVTSTGGLSTYAQGDMLYASNSSTLARLAKDTNATRYLSNQGSSNNPSWNQVNLTDGVTGTLPIGSGGTGRTATGTADQIYSTNTAGTGLEYRTLNVDTSGNSAFGWQYSTNNTILNIPDYQTCTPAYGAVAPMDWTSVTTTFCQFIRFGNMTCWQLEAVGTTSGTASATLTITPPVNASMSGNASIGGVHAVDGGPTAPGYGYFNSSSQVYVFKNDSTNFGLGGSRLVRLNFCYKT